MPSFNVAIANSGSAATLAASGTIAAGSNISAVVSVVYEDLTHTGLTCSQGGATVSAGSATSLVRNEVIYRVIGLSAGSVSFTGTGSGSGSINIVAIVLNDAVQDLTTGFGAIATDYQTTGSPGALSVSTGDADDLVAAFLWSGGGAGGPPTAGSGTLRASTGPAGYGHYAYGATFTRAGATTTTDWTWSGINPYLAGVAVKHAAGDVTAPTLTSPTASATGQTTASGSVSTDEDNGTLSAVVTTSATAPSAAQVAAGQDHTGAAAADSASQAVSATGVQTISGGFTGLTASTTYYAHYMHEDAATNRSTVASSSSFTTDSPPLATHAFTISRALG
jgi:hypothetical protein